MKNYRIFLAGVMLLLPVLCAAQDEDAGGDGTDSTSIKLAKEDDNHPCAPDMHKFCESLYNGERMEQWNCLQEHKDGLSSPCKKELGLIVQATAQKQSKKQKPRQKSLITGDHPCVSDLDQFCADVKGKPEKEIKCLQSNSQDITKECKARLRKDSLKNRKKRVKTVVKKTKTDPDQE